MDLGNIIYIIAFIFYIIYQVIKKKGEQELPERQDSEPQAPQKGMSFEDLLKEIRDAQKPTTIEVPRPKPAPEVLPTGERVKRKREVVLEDEDDEIQRYAGAFESAPKNKYQSYAEKTPIVNEPSTRASYEPNLAKKSNPYAEKLRNPQSVKEALVLSEILNRKHF